MADIRDARPDRGGDDVRKIDLRAVLVEAVKRPLSVDEALAVEQAVERSQREHARMREAERCCTHLAGVLAQVAHVLGEPGLELEPAVLVARLQQRLTELDHEGCRLHVSAPQPTRRALSLVARARAKCEDRFGLRSLTQSGRCTREPKHALAVLGEEYGEVCRALLEHEGDGRLLSELVDTAQVCVAWVEVLLVDGDVEQVTEAVLALEGGAQ